MLLEAVIFALSVAGSPRSAWPHLGGAVALWSRGRRQRQTWDPHVRQTAGLITERAARLKSRRTVAVLGSGPLFDVPVQELSSRFRRVLLVDHVHLLPARIQVRGLSNVELLWRDLSAITHCDPLGFLRDIADLDLVVSVNLASQLAVSAPRGREREVIDAHLDGLFALPVPAALVTDIAYAELDRSGRVVERFDLMYGRRMPKPATRWTWEVAPLGEESPSLRRLHAVCYYPDWHAASAARSTRAEKPFIPGNEPTRLFAGAVP